MSEWYFWFFSANLAIALTSSLGYGFYRHAFTDKEMVWGERFLWPLYVTSLIWLFTPMLKLAYEVSGYLWLQKPEPWWPIIVVWIAGLFAILLSIWLGSWMKSLHVWVTNRFAAKQKGDNPYAETDNLGWDGHPVHKP